VPCPAGPLAAAQEAGRRSRQWHRRALRRRLHQRPRRSWLPRGGGKKNCYERAGPFCCTLVASSPGRMASRSGSSAYARTSVRTRSLLDRHPRCCLRQSCCCCPRRLSLTLVRLLVAAVSSVSVPPIACPPLPSPSPSMSPLLLFSSPPSSTWSRRPLLVPDRALDACCHALRICRRHCARRLARGTTRGPRCSH
jgi:hypothetical protein